MTMKLKFQVVPMTEVAREDEVVLRDRSRPVVLIVDDEKVIADTLSMILSKSGFTTMTAYDGISALELAVAIAPDLIISDVMMPGMTGVELAIAVTQTLPSCRILLFSGQAATLDLLKEARRAGHDFTTLTKPVHPTDMLRRISECLATRDTAYPTSQSSTDHTIPTMTYGPN